MQKNPTSPLTDAHRSSVATALAWNAVRKTLEVEGKSELLPFITSVKLDPDRITIITKKPIVNSELSLLREPLKRAIITSIAGFGIKMGEVEVVLR